VQWPLILHSGAGRARVRPWCHDPDVAQLTFTDHGFVPTSTGLRVWLSELRTRGFAAVRTGAVGEAGADTLQRQGFEVVQRLALLDLSLVGWRAPAANRVRTEQLRVRDRAAAAEVDRAAFGDPWALDPLGITETCKATPAHRSRTVDGSTGAGAGLIGYAITGRADFTGYLQRLAVCPDHQGRGVGFSLTRDSLVWMQRRRLTRAMVNTHIDNVVALRLYQRFGFRVMPQGLVVLSRGLDDL
jgi:ribosomal protein S18 acetylase RimI-like enzyme